MYHNRIYIVLYVCMPIYIYIYIYIYYMCVCNKQVPLLWIYSITYLVQLDFFLKILFVSTVSDRS